MLKRLNQVGILFSTVTLVASMSVFAACGDDDPALGPKPSVDGGDGSSGGGDGSSTVQPTRFSRANRGSGIDISEDDTILVAVNRDVGTISVFDVAGAAATKKAEVQVCAEPWQVTVTPNGDRAYVVCRLDQKVVRVDGLRGAAPAKGPEVKVGSEPTAIALTPKATSAWVANWMDGTVQEIDAEAMTVKNTVDLNAALVGTGALGQVTARPALAHPRSIAITNNKDDLEDDESVFVTEFFAQQKEALGADGLNADIARKGLVYRISVKDRAVRTIDLNPIADIGLKDQNDVAAGCFPNQLQSIDVQGSFAYVVSICASPRGPLGDFTGPAFINSCTADGDCPGGGAGSCNLVNTTCKTNCTSNAQCGANGGVCDQNVCKLNLVNARTIQTPAVHVIDIGGNKVIASVPLNGEFDKHFTANGIAPDTSARRFPATATDIAFVPGTLISYIAAKGADAIYRVEFNATYETKAIDALGSAGRPFIPLDLGTLDATKQGKTPIAITVAHKAKVDSTTGRFAFVLNESTRNVTTLDLSKDDIAGLPDAPAVASATAMPAANSDDEKRLDGRRLFNTGLGRWSFQGQAWGACESCHIDGLSDQVTWFHLRGPRQTPSLDQTFNKKNNKVRFQNWSAIADEFEDHEGGALRSILGGVGAIVKNQDLANTSRIAFQAGLNGSAKASADPASSSTVVGEVNVLNDWLNLSRFMRTIRTPKKPSNLDQAQVDAGRNVFSQANCQGCHGNENWTISEVFYAPDPNAPASAATNLNQKLKTTSWTAAVTTFPPTLLPTDLPGNQMMRYNGTNPAGLDSMTCLLRPVGTYGIGEAGVTVPELRRTHNPAQPGQGNEATGKGFNVPSLIGAAVNAPYFHAGNARTLEGLLSDVFASHHGALSTGFLGAGDPQSSVKRAQLVQFLLSIDADSAMIAAPTAAGPNGGNFCAPPP
jgi:mono/diheme cytochrome c family protein